MKLKSGFTLAELLIALAILGVIATFTIPKVLQSSQNQQRNAVMRETISALEQISIEGVRSGEILPDGSNLIQYFSSHMNAIKVCDTDSTAQGCWQGGEFAWEATEPGFILASGAVILGINNIPSATGFTIDWNGVQGSNSIGEDTIYLTLCYVSSGPCPAIYSAGYKDFPGKIGPYGGSPTPAANAAFYDAIFTP